MTDEFPDSILFGIGEMVAARMGLHFPRERWNALESALKKAAKPLGFQDVVSLSHWLLASPQEETRVECLAPYLTIGETHFFRDEKLFRAFEDHLVPQLTASRGTYGRRLRFWSAGCATGEEPYSIAIVLKETIKQLADWHVTILATDINRDFLEKAAQGAYSQWSFRVVPERVRQYYFTRNGDGYRIAEDIKKMVTFRYLNLAIDDYPHTANDTESMDVIFCRNVLMYFTPERQTAIVERLFRCLTNDGLLVVSPAEASIVEHPHLVPENVPGTVLFRKSDKPKPMFEGFQFVLPESVPQICLDTTPDFLRLPWPPENEEEVSEILPFLAEVAPVPVEVSPGPGRDRYELALELYHRGDYPAVIAELLPGFDPDKEPLDDSSGAALLLSKAFANKGDLQDALKWSQKAVADEKLNPEGHYLHGAILQEMDRIEEAVLAMNRAVFLDPDLVVAHFALGNLFQRRGKRKDRDRHYRIALGILRRYAADDTVPASEGMTAGRLSELIEALSRKES
jgi:chemotaxis protein methyltransferase CheR